ncbi:MAG: class I SAM-dependent methyltransferase [bacterium]
MKPKENPIKVKDHFNSGETFSLEKDEQFGFLKTTPIPHDLHKYYDHEDYISHTDSKKSLFDLAYQFIKGIALKRKVKLINELNPSEKSLLDIGCGAGDFLSEAKKDGWAVTGIEPNNVANKIASSKISQEVLNDVEDICIERSFHAITLWHVLEHLPDLNAKIKRIKKLLANNGWLIIAVPNHQSFDASYYKEYWAAYDVPRHLWHFDKDSLKRLMDFHDMEVKEIAPMKFDSYYVSLLSEKYKSGWLNIFNALFVGSSSNLKARSNMNYSSLIYLVQKK